MDIWCFTILQCLISGSKNASNNFSVFWLYNEPEYKIKTKQIKTKNKTTIMPKEFRCLITIHLSELKFSDWPGFVPLRVLDEQYNLGWTDWRLCLQNSHNTSVLLNAQCSIVCDTATFHLISHSIVKQVIPSRAFLTKPSYFWEN